MYVCDVRVEIKNRSLPKKKKKIILNSMENTMIFHRPVFRTENFLTSTKDSVWSFSLFLTFGLHKAYFSLKPKL